MQNDLLTLRRAMDRLFEDAVEMSRGTNGNGHREGNHLLPRADAWESADELVVQLALPGVEPESVDVTYEQDTLSVNGSFPTAQKSHQRLLSELPRGEFRRRFTLQLPIDADGIEAHYSNGLLTLRLPKSERVKPRKIEVRSS